MNRICETRYPLFLVHGLGFRDRKRLGYWGRIPKALEQHGAAVFFGGQDGGGSVEGNAAQLKERLEEILTETGCSKVNIIAHSKGGLEARSLISTLGMGEHVASLTTISTPHHGSQTVDRLLRLPAFLVRACASLCNVSFRLMGDKAPDALAAFHMLSTGAAGEFNQRTPDVPGVYYQSYAFVLSHSRSDMLLFLPHLAVNWVEGENDGLLTPASARWTNFRGVVRSASGRGISHCDQVDLRRRRLTKKRVEGRVSDVTEFYVSLVAELKEKGF